MTKRSEHDTDEEKDLSMMEATLNTSLEILQMT